MQSDSELQMTIYPFTKFKGMLLWSYPSIKENPGKQMDVVRNFKSRPDDILMCTFQKSGSHWLHEIICMIVEQTTEYNSRPASFQIHLDFLTDHSELEKETRRRILHTHLPYGYIPKSHIDLGGKIIYLNRNPKDRHVSQYCFFKNLRGFPEHWKWEDYYQELVRDGNSFIIERNRKEYHTHTIKQTDKSLDTVYGGWWKYTKEYEEAMRTNKNILPVTFEDLKLDTVRQIQKVAEFLGHEATTEFATEIADKVTFEKLKVNKQDASVAIAKDAKSTLFRKGEIGDWKNYFTVAQNEEFDNLYGTEMDGYDVKFIYDY